MEVIARVQAVVQAQVVQVVAARILQEAQVSWRSL